MRFPSYKDVLKVGIEQETPIAGLLMAASSYVASREGVDCEQAYRIIVELAQKQFAARRL